MYISIYVIKDNSSVYQICSYNFHNPPLARFTYSLAGIQRL